MEENINFINMILTLRDISEQALTVLSSVSSELEAEPAAAGVKLVLDMAHTVIKDQAEVIRRMSESQLRISDQISDLAVKAEALKEKP